MPRASFDTWVRDTEVVSCEDGRLVIGTGNSYARDWLESRLASTVNRLLVSVLNTSVSVHFIVNGNEIEEALDEVSPLRAQPVAYDQTQGMSDAAYEGPARPTSLNPRYVFETFVVGSGNRLAHC